MSPVPVASACMMFGTKSGMVMNSRWFEFMAAAKSTGFVRWSDVAGYRVDIIIPFQKMLVVLLKDPDAYCREHGGLSKANMSTCGSPVCIPKAAALAIDFNSMVSLFGRYFAKWGVEGVRREDAAARRRREEDDLGRGNGENPRWEGRECRREGGVRRHGREGRAVMPDSRRGTT